MAGEQILVGTIGVLLLTCPLLLVILLLKFIGANSRVRQSAKSLAETSALLDESRSASAAARSLLDQNRLETENAISLWKQLEGEKNSLLAHLKKLESRFRPVMDLDNEAHEVRCSIAALNEELTTLRTSYADKKVIYDRLLQQVVIFDDRLAFAEMGVYEPHFDYSDSEDYKRAIEASRTLQKARVSSKTAVVCPINWTVDGSSAKGQTMTNRNIRLTLRAFNNECEAAIANTRWNNVNAMERRIENAFAQINTLNESNRVTITSEYFLLKLEELRLTHEYREKLRAEREERAELARAQKEEQKLIRDMERAEEEEARYQRLLHNARSEAEKAVGPRLEAFNAQIELLERELADAHAKFERAQAMAERTRSGYVYIISNVGSFGEDVVKIGLTRRLDPADRVRELGDASVPFIFDTHAIIYSDDAPALERALHNEFKSVRVNALNYRKEFFRARLDDVEAAVARLAPDAPFFKDVEAQDYRETLAKRNAVLLALDVANDYRLPEAI